MTMLDQLRYQAEQLYDLRRHAEENPRVLDTANALAPILQGYRRQAETIAAQLVAIAVPAWPVNAGSPQLGADEIASNIDWLLLGQLALRVFFAAIVLAGIVAAWQEQKDSAPAITLLEIFGALGLWCEIDGKIWRKSSRSANSP